MASSELKEDYYKVMEIAKHATAEDIKKAYRKLALRYHPDKNPGDPETAAVQFKKISEAFAVLSDPKRRQTYDTYGHSGLRDFEQQHSDQPRRSTKDLFREVFGDDPFFSSFFSSPFMADDIGVGFGRPSTFGATRMGGGFPSFPGFGSNMDMFGGGGFSSSSSFSSGGGLFNGRGGGMYSESRSTSTIIQNGRQITTTKTTINGKTTERTEEKDIRTGTILSLKENGKTLALGN